MVSFEVLDGLAEDFYWIFHQKEPQRLAKGLVETLSLGEAYAVQDRVVQRRVMDGERVAGFKVGCTSNAIRRQFGLKEPICGRLMKPHIHYGSVSLNIDAFTCCAVEPEFVLRIGRTPGGGDLSDEALLDSIDAVAPGIEVHHYKFWNGSPTSQELIASNGIHACLIVGGAWRKPDALQLRQAEVELNIDGQSAASGRGSEIMESGPLASLRWLVQHLEGRGLTLDTGDLVIPGSPVELVQVPPNARVTARISNLGEAEAIFKK